MGNREDSVVLKKAFDFAIRVVKICYQFNQEKEYVLSKQLLRSGTSIGANINEALAAHTRKDFQYKMSISLKEAQETEYWLKLLKESGIFAIDFDSLIVEVSEIQKILTAIIKTSKTRGEMVSNS